MAFIKKNLELAIEKNGSIPYRVWRYNTTDTPAACKAANYFAGCAAETVLGNVGLYVSDVIEVVQWPAVPTHNRHNRRGYAMSSAGAPLSAAVIAAYEGDPAGAVYLDTAAPLAFARIMVTDVETDPASADYGDATAALDA